MNKQVEIKVDLDRRENLRRLHTATHIVNYSAKKVLGNHVWQNGSNLKPEFGTLDITHYDNLTSDEIMKIEKIANDTVFENKNVSIEELDRTKAEEKYGYTLYQGGAIPLKKLRIIHVVDSDIEACGGIHMEKTGGIGLIKIISSQKIQDGVIRLKYVVRDFALQEINKKENILGEVCESFSVDETKILNTSQKFFNEWKKQKKEIDLLKDQLKSSYLLSIENSKENEFKLKGNFDMGFLMELFSNSLTHKKSFKLISDNFTIATPDIKVKDFKKEIKKGNFNIYIM